MVRAGTCVASSYTRKKLEMLFYRRVVMVAERRTGIAPDHCAMAFADPKRTVCPERWRLGGRKADDALAASLP